MRLKLEKSKYKRENGLYFKEYILINNYTGINTLLMSTTRSTRTMQDKDSQPPMAFSQ